HVAVRARAWVEQLLALPSAPMLETRRLARADLVAALQPERIELDRFIDAWYSDDTQGALRALMAKLGK
ncbi:MAG TPA: enoyl-CoA hydratase/isomerase family protein, partial [Luteimonas sp.]|nr:enoyl-CoA hydratase/isomerase family protein [Luteimonas sp.]